MAAKMAGLLGGMGPESTLEYYRLLQDGYRRRKPDGSYPAILINSVNLQEMVALINAGDTEGLTRFLLLELGRLSQAGATFGLLTANTPHLVFDELRARSPIPLISIVESTAQAADKLGLRRLGLFGTRFTMQARFYPDVMRRFGIEVVSPDPDDQLYIHERYMGELVPGVFREETREALLGIAGRMREQQRIDGLILGGTELPLLLKQPEHRGLPFLDTTRIHVERVLDELV